MSTIHPIIFLSISDTGLDIVETIKKESKSFKVYIPKIDM